MTGTTELYDDIKVFCENKHKCLHSSYDSFCFLMSAFPEFRSLYYFRLSNKKYIKKILSFLAPPQKCLYIFSDEKCGAGCYIEHGFSTIISCRRFGKNFRFNQQVTVGWSKDGCPIIGDNVQIFAGAKVFGSISIGNNVVIGANAVVNKSVPDNVTVVGVPARIVKLNGIKVNIPL